MKLKKLLIIIIGLYFFILLFFVLSKDKKVTLTHDNIERNYEIHVPIIYNKKEPTPLVIVLHGGGSNSKRVKLSFTL